MFWTGNNAYPISERYRAGKQIGILPSALVAEPKFPVFFSPANFPAERIARSGRLQIVNVLYGILRFPREITSRITSEHVETGSHVYGRLLFRFLLFHGLAAVLFFGTIFRRTVFLFRTRFVRLCGFGFVFHDYRRSPVSHISGNYITGVSENAGYAGRDPFPPSVIIVRRKTEIIQDSSLIDLYDGFFCGNVSGRMAFCANGDLFERFAVE